MSASLVATDPAVRAAADAYVEALARETTTRVACLRAWGACGPAELNDPTIRPTYDRTRAAADAARHEASELHAALLAAIRVSLVLRELR